MSESRKPEHAARWTLRVVEDKRNLQIDTRAACAAMVLAVLLILLAEITSTPLAWLCRLAAVGIISTTAFFLASSWRNAGRERCPPPASIPLRRHHRHPVHDHDELTGLPSMHCLEPAISRVRRQMAGLAGKVAVLVFDLDSLTDINGCHGFQTGDALLRKIAERLAELDAEIVARTSGDRFVMLLGHLASAGEAELKAARALERVKRQVAITTDTNTTILKPSVSIGIAVWPDHGESLDDLIRRADMAMNEAKLSGGGRYRMFSDNMIRSLRKRSEMERDLERAIGENQLHLQFQSQVDLGSGKVSGFEALMRWTHPERGNVPPAQFIPVAESSGLIRPIGMWLIDEACHYCSLWRQYGVDLTMAINISAAQLRQPDLPEIIATSLASHNIPPGSLELELTESLFVDPTEIMMRRNIEQLAKKGLKMAIDDFGTGYSSLAYLKRLPVGKIKIDRSFVSGVGHDASDEAIVSAIIGLGHTFRRTILAEGVETENQRAFLASAGCDLAQGYLFSKPMPFRQALRLIDPQMPTTPRTSRDECRLQPGIG